MDSAGPKSSQLAFEIRKTKKPSREPFRQSATTFLKACEPRATKRNVSVDESRLQDCCKYRPYTFCHAQIEGRIRHRRRTKLPPWRSADPIPKITSYIRSYLQGNSQRQRQIIVYCRLWKVVCWRGSINGSLGLHCVLMVVCTMHTCMRFQRSIKSVHLPENKFCETSRKDSSPNYSLVLGERPANTQGFKNVEHLKRTERISPNDRFTQRVRFICLDKLW